MGCLNSTPSNKAPTYTSAAASTPNRPAAQKGGPTNAAGYKPRRRGSVSAEADKSAEDKYVPKKIPKSEAQRKFLKGATAGIFLFQGLNQAQLDEVVDAVERKTVSAGDQVIVQGDEGDYFYVIESGNFRVIKDGKPVHEYKGTGFFGELALMYNAKRAATIEASGSGVVWALDRVTFRHIITISSKKRVKVSEDSLEKVDILKSLSKTDRAKVADALTSIEYKDGETVISQGEYGATMYIVEEGEAVASISDSKGKAANKREVNRHGPGDYFGERALITNEPRAASVVASGVLKVWSIDRAAFERLLGSDIKKKMNQRISTYQ